MVKHTDSQKSQIRAKKGYSGIFFVILFILVLFVAYYLHIAVPYDDVMGGSQIRFTSVDEYYHLIAADYTYDNWPDVQRWNTQLSYPDGMDVGQRPVNSWLIATFAKVFSTSVDVAGAWFPAYLSLLILILAFILGWLLWNKWAGLITMVALGTIHGEFLGRISLGSCDHHALETFLMLCTMILFIFTIKRNWLWSIVASFFMFLYMFNWAGAPILILILLLYNGVQAIYDHWKGHPNGRLCATMVIILAPTTVLFFILRPIEYIYHVFLVIATIIPVVLYFGSKYLLRFKPYWYLVGLVCAAVGILGTAYAIAPKAVRYATYELGGLIGSVGASPLSIGRTISEVQPLFSPYGEFTMSLVWGGYGIVFFTGLIGLVVLGITLRRYRTEYFLVALWTLCIFLITTLQRRFGYYLSVNLCLMTGFLCWYLVDKFGKRKLSKKEIKRGVTLSYSPIVIGIVVIIFLAGIVLPNYTLSEREAKMHPYSITNAWIESCHWLRDKTEEGEYSVLSWWDYGYWIARDGDRNVPCHPGGGSSDKAAKFFISQCTNDANEWAELLKVKYIVIDYQMVTSKYYAMPLIAGHEDWDESKYNDSMVTRLYYSDNGIEGYKLVFQSSDKYKGESQVKVYERYEVLKGG